VLFEEIIIFVECIGKLSWEDRMALSLRSQGADNRAWSRDLSEEGGVRSRGKKKNRRGKGKGSGRVNEKRLLGSSGWMPWTRNRGVIGSDA
jgi:hypothetical protein